MEAELFGHERGAFTDAKAVKKSLFEVSDGATLFLDEIGELSPLLQAKLLRVLEDQVIRRVGGRGTCCPLGSASRSSSDPSLACLAVAARPCPPLFHLI
jgi:sigma54-dependent transcription regulator